MHGFPTSNFSPAMILVRTSYRYSLISFMLLNTLKRNSKLLD